MSSRFRLRRSARTDIREAALWYEDQKSGLGSRFQADLDRLFEHITEHPQQFPETSEGVRRALLLDFPYNIYFRIQRDSVLILAVTHQSRFQPPVE